MMPRRLAVTLFAALFAAAPLGAESALDFDQAAPNPRDALSEAKASAQGQPNAPAAPLERRIVVFEKGVERDAQIKAVQASGASVVKVLWLINAMVVEAPSKQARLMAASLQSQSSVKRVEEDFYQNWIESAPSLPATAPRTPAPAAAAAAGQKIPWGIARVHAPRAWSLTRGKGVKVAVVDTGIDFRHPDLSVAGGYDAISGKSYWDDHSHGTHVAGTIAALDNGFGVVGVAPEASLYAVKVLNAYGSGTFSDIIEGLQWCVENEMDVANLSLGARLGSKSLEEAVQAASLSGVVVVAAAGNSGAKVGFPGAYENAIAVAASDIKDQTAYFSSRGPEVDFIAPGVDVESTVPGGGYKKFNGTSMATPHVTGLVALAVSAKNIYGENALRSALEEAAVPLRKVKAPEQGAGFISAKALLTEKAKPKKRKK